ncbi:hypothetical protein KsCSTR_04310 [Candidatus Kuenenia stuttgartiensis]|uniref:Uncharacterized protein n=1 Tax=Kuenenia stuttgartiensis TaxID=174633 RepID=A0A6G7GJL1_KUEST|nr:hypothetical protein KsCSTR_04310 [Candidatus Kuenenia stuttgartiensis]
MEKRMKPGYPGYSKAYFDPNNSCEREARASNAITLTTTR